MDGLKTISYFVNSGSSVKRHLYIKEHKCLNSHPSKPVGRTLLVFAVPPYSTEEALNRFFSEFGSVERVIIQQQPSSSSPPLSQSDSSFEYVPITGFKVAYVVFQTPTALATVIKSKSRKGTRILFDKETPCISGMKKWALEYAKSKPEKHVLKSEIDDFMKKYEEEEEKRKNEDSVVNQPGEEGWITVTRGGKKGGFKRRTADDIFEEEKVKRKKKKKGSQISFFYSSSMKESKVNYVKELRRQFEEDKKRLAAAQEKRKFRP